MDYQNKTKEELIQIIENLNKDFSLLQNELADVKKERIYTEDLGDQIKTAKAEAEEYAWKYHQLFNNTLDHIFVLEITGNGDFLISAVNPAQAREMGLLEVGKCIHECLNDETLKNVLKNYNRCLTEQKPIIYEENLLNKDFLTQLVPLKDKKGKIYKLIGISRNITREKILTRELIVQNERLRILNSDLKNAKEKAEESDRLKTSFLHNLSHEIRTPMNAIVGFSQLLVTNFNDKDKLELFAGIISKQCDDLLVLIDEILDIAKIESGQVSVNIGYCNINELFNELSLLFSDYQINQGKQHIKFSLIAQCDESRKIILTDPVKLKQIFTNLLDNAFKFTDNGTIDAGCLIDNQNNLVFYVSDTGIGIPEDKQKAIFDRFIQLQQNPERLYGGTGLGLAIVKGLIELLSGRIWVKSAIDKGTTFYFTLHHFATELDNPVSSEITFEKAVTDNILHPGYFPSR